MEVVITARHGNISKNEQTWIRRKLGRLSRFFNGSHPAKVVVEHTGDRSAVEMSMSAPRGIQLSAHAEDSSLRAAVSKAEAKLEAQVRKLKDRLVHKKGGVKVDYSVH